MGSPARKVKPATIEDLLAIPEEERRHEIIDGELVQKAQPTFTHGRGQGRLYGRVSEPYDRRPGRRGPGGFWLALDVEVALAPNQIYRPDLVGWRRERVPEQPTEWPVRIRPDWVCEVLSPNNRSNDRVKKYRNYHRFEVPHYWILDPMDETLTVFRWTEPGYLVALIAEGGERVHAEPFEAVELDINELFGDADEEEPTEG
ncbi:Uma2 family endonuclease [Polyangium jinanense]|uniref:Uma2 family endonuclease n=1 Tax=Polyangium jinanense TaxID=2829994 RepID=A0A9X3X2F0_9BACT|nr:Uma2 family endonuclease [Polyangium jinanense]MDC3956022.1 Uma2 family endonuclease [Polyangium jinanense]MDC3982947.1 Uma2 family endonuclease [Polyangium jinanense]